MQLSISRPAAIRTVAIILGVGALIVLGIFVAKLITAASPWTQTNWAGGSGQTAFVDPTKYNTDNGSVNTTSTPGLFTLQNFRQDLGYSAVGVDRQVDATSLGVNTAYQGVMGSAILSNNNYAFVYIDDADGMPKLRILDPTGANVLVQTTIDTTPFPVLPPLTLSGYDQIHIAATATGFVVIYRADNGISGNKEIYLKRYSNAGVDSDVGAAKVIVSNPGNHLVLGRSSLAVDSLGDIYVSFFQAPSSLANTPGDVFVRKISASTAGTVWTTQLNASGQIVAFDTSVDVNGLGQGSVVWLKDVAGMYYLEGRVWNSTTGVAVGAAEVDFGVLGIAKYPRVTTRRDLTGSNANQFDVVWTELPVTPTINHRLFRVDQTMGTSSTIGSSHTSPNNITSRADRVTGNMVYAWTDNNVNFVEIRDITDTVIVPKTQISAATSDVVMAPNMDVASNNRLLIANNRSYTSGLDAGEKHMTSMVYLFPALSGVVTSSVFDAGATNTVWGVMTYLATLPTGATATVRFRTGNTATPDGTWNAYQTITTGSDIASSLDGRRYAQYEVTLARSNATASPTFEEINFQYSFTTTTTPVTPGAPSTGKGE